MLAARSLAVAVFLIGIDALAQPAPGSDPTVEPSGEPGEAVSEPPAKNAAPESDWRDASDPSQAWDPDDHIDPSQVPPPEELPESPFPRAVVQRTLLLQPGRVEGRVGLGFGRESVNDMSPITYGAVVADVRLGLRGVEVDIGGWWAPVHADPQDATYDVPSLQELYAAAKVRITDDTGLGVAADLRAPASKIYGYSSSLFVEHKMRPSEHGAIVTGARVAYASLREPISTGYSTSSSAVLGVLVLSAQLQLTPTTAVVATGSGGIYQYLDDGHPGRRSGFAGSYSGGFVLSLNNTFDLDPFIQALGLQDPDGFVAGLSLVAH